MDAASGEVRTRSALKSRMSSSCSTRSDSSERWKQNLDDYDVDFDVRPPSGTNHQQPGKHLSIDTRFAELSLDNSSLIAESEREPLNLHRKDKTRPNRVQVPKGNFYITSPFKQGPEKDTKGHIMVVDPSLDLKQRTIAGVTKVRKQLEHEKRIRNTKLHHSQLLMGNLKALGRPMTASGPGINSCQGIVAGRRTYHGFARRKTEGSLATVDSCRQLSESVPHAMCVSAWRDSPCRPEGSAHHTSIASSVDGANNDSVGILSEDESVDSIDVGTDACDLRDEAKVVPSVKDLTYSTRGNDNNSKQSRTCKSYVDCYHNKVPHPDDDDDDDCQEERRWAREPNRFVVYNGDEGRENIGDNGHKTSSSNAAQGKRRSSRMNGDEERRRWRSDLGVSDARVDGLNISAPKKSGYRYSTDRKELSF